jgi:hypothetical protein
MRSVALGDLAGRFGMAGAGALLLLLAIPAFLPVPLPTGVPAGIAAALLGLQLAAGRSTPWLPGWVGRLRLRRDQLASGLARLLRLLGRLGLRLRRRWPGMVGRDGAPRLLTGFMLVACGIVLVLPLPFGNQLPSLAIAATGLGLLRRDGVFILAGHVLAVVALAWAAMLLAFGIQAVQMVVPA